MAPKSEETSLPKPSAQERRFQEIESIITERLFELFNAQSPEDQKLLSEEIQKLDLELARAQSSVLSRQGAATDRQRTLIDQSFTRRLAAVNEQLSTFGTEQLLSAAAEFRGRGLEPGETNTPGFARSAQIAKETQRQQGLAASTLGANAAQLEATINAPSFQSLLSGGNVVGARSVTGQLSGQVGAGLQGLRGLRIAQPTITRKDPIGAVTGLLQGIGSATGGQLISSSREVKEDLRDIDTKELLRKIRDLQIQRWRYRADSEEVDHIGPYAEDFKAAFGLGDSDKHIHLVDTAGVALAGIQELADRLDAIESRQQAA